MKRKKEYQFKMIKTKDSATELSMTMTDPLYIHRGRRKGVKSEGMRRELV